MTRGTVIVLTLGLAAILGAGLASGQDGRIRSGRMLYDDHCFRCHGMQGRGDGPDAAGLIVKPADFQSRRIRAKSDYELWMSAAYGVAYTPMHGWMARLTEEELLEVLQYIRELAPVE